MVSVINPATATDLPAILALLERNQLPTAGLSEHLATALVVRDGGEIVGSVALEVYGEVALLRSLAVDARQRNQGLGQRLTLAALGLARQHGVAIVCLLTETASQFFPRFGFRAIARAEAPPAVQRSIEFTSACPASAQAMLVALAER